MQADHPSRPDLAGALQGLESIPIRALNEGWMLLDVGDKAVSSRRFTGALGQGVASVNRFRQPVMRLSPQQKTAVCRICGLLLKARLVQGVVKARCGPVFDVFVSAAASAIQDGGGHKAILSRFGPDMVSGRAAMHLLKHFVQRTGHVGPPGLLPQIQAVKESGDIQGRAIYLGNYSF